MKDSNLDFIPKTPDVASVGKYIDKPISLSNGSVNVNVPIYSVPINNSMTIPVNLNYNTQGIKVTDISSSVGQGWNLSTIGMVSRNIRGKVDNYNDAAFYIQNIASAKINLAENTLNSIPNAWLEQNYDNLDLEPDEFNVSLFNMSFKFFYDFTTNKFVSAPLNNIKIIPSLNNYGGIISFKIIDGNGNTYFFGRSDDNDNRFEVIDEVSSTTVSNDSAYSNGTAPQFNTWLLLKITTNDNKNVRFYYEDNYVSVTDITDQDIYLNAQYKYYANTLQILDGTYDIISWEGNQPHVIGSKFPISSEIAKTKEGKVYNVYNAPVTLDKILKKIIYDNTEIEFEKSTVKRKDFNAYSLDKIKIKSNNNVIKTFQLNHSYFNDEYATPSPDNARNNNYIFTKYFDRSRFRLKLDAVSEYDRSNQLINKYQFEYFPGELPSKLSFAQDFFGYFNGMRGNAELIPNINFKFGNALKNAGTAQRQVDLDNSKIGMLKKIVYPTGGSTEFEYENHTYQAINDVNEAIIGDLFSLKMEYITFAGEQSADPNTGEQLPPEMNYEMPVEFEEDANVDLNTQIYKVFDENNSPNNSYNLIIYRKVNGNWEIFTLMSYSIQKTVFFPKGEYLLTAHRTILTVNEGGLFDDGGGFALMMSFLKPTQNTPPDNNNPITIQKAGGLRIKSIIQKENNIKALQTEYSYNETVNGQLWSTGILYGYPLLVTQDFYEGINKFYGVIDYPFRSGSGTNIVYGKVTETSVNELTNKKIKKEYFFENNVPVEIDEATIEFRTRTPYVGWKLGSLKKVLYYKNNDNDSFSLIKKDSTIYDQNNYTVNYVFGVKIEPRDKVLSLSYTPGQGFPTNYDFSTKFKYEYYPLFTDFTFESKKLITEYFGDKTLVTTTENSYLNPNYQLSKQKVVFSDGSIQESNYQYAYEKANQKLINANMNAIPLETTLIKKGSESDPGTIVTKTEVKYDNPSTLLPSSVLSYDLQTGASSTELLYDQYDSKGNIIQYTTKGGISVSIIWGYDTTKPIAKIEGAKIYDIPQSLIDSIVNASNTDATSGTDASEQSLITALDAFRNNAGLSAFQISTYTYDPLIGVRSITPPSGIREFYKYDTSNRLEKVVDANGKVLKEYQYHYKN